MAALLNVHSLYHDLKTVHPLPRASILHLHGCRKGRTDPCAGCGNAELWGEEDKWRVEPGELAEWVLSRAAASALSISGGEPLDQYEPLCRFLQILWRYEFCVLMWTGFEMVQVRRSYGDVLPLLDFIVTGPYDQERRTGSSPFVSSRNQRIHCLTDRAEHVLRSRNHTVEYEIVIPKDGTHPVSLGVDVLFR